MLDGQFWPRQTLEFGPGMVGAVPGQKQALAASYITQVSSDSDTPPYTFSSAAIGAAAVDRLVVVFAFVWGSTPVVSGVTIGGVAADVITGFGGVAGYALLCKAIVPTGTTADIVIAVSSGTCSRAGVSVFRLVGLQSYTAFDSGSPFGDPASDTLNATFDGVVVAGGVISANETFTWTGVTEQHDTLVESATRYSAAFAAAAPPDLAISADSSGSTSVNVRAASFG